jgi:YHS domain-containing protein
MKNVCLAVLLLVINFSIAIAQKAEVFSTSDGAIRGYDAVAYFTMNKPVKGDKQFTTNYNGADWFFSSEENLTVFKASPEKYAPQFGGYCAYAVSQNYTYDTEPDAFTVLDGKLYLNANLKTSKYWNSKRDELIPAAIKNWPEVFNK